ncbi:MAG: CDGSH iron-sulfur domain-containing protein, partial [Sneathiella sp.]|nr:CDGSH iron-sulfur domain-containing protein [Sneathiella sp.]
MDKPTIADRKPIKAILEAGETYHWCACGKSSNQPFCDGSHRDTSFTPLAFEAAESGDAFLCMCKHSNNAPYCDGTHSRLPVSNATQSAEALPKSTQGKMPTAAPTPEEPTVKEIHDLAKDGLSKVGHHGEMTAMGVPRPQLPDWNDIQILPAQFARKPLMDDRNVGTELVIGPNAKKPLTLKIPLFVSDMSFGALSEEAKIALSTGAELAGTGICSGEGGMLPEEQAANSRYFYELASAGFGYKEELL